MKKDEVLVVGSVALDDVETPFGRREISLGGSAVYFSWACSNFTRVQMVGVVGSDFPDEHIKDLNSRGVDTRSLEKKEAGKTFHWKGRYDFDFNTAHTLDTQLNVFSDFKPVLQDDQKDMDFLFLANIDPEIQLQVASEMRSPKVIATDTMNFWIDSKRPQLMEVLKITDFLLINDAEAKQLGEEGSLVAACNKILTWGPRIIIVKQGEYGVSMFYSENDKIEVFSAPSIPLETVKDPTGAGDSFAGAFMGYIARSGNINHQNIRRAVAVGSVVASYTVEGFSIDSLSTVDMDKINKRYDKLRKMAFFEKIDPGELS